MKNFILFLIYISIANFVSAQVAKTQTVMISAVAVNGKGILLKWPVDVFTGTYSIHKRTDLLIDNWGNQPFVTLPSYKFSFFDSTLTEGSAAEYLILKMTGQTVIATGVIYAGNKLTEPVNNGAIILLIDSNYMLPLSAELQQLKSDLKKEGMLVQIVFAGRNESPTIIRNKLISIYALSKRKITSLFIIGHVPVPYSGYFSNSGDAPPPDGHIEGSGNHTGAWPADVYYGEMDGTWTDETVICTTAASPRNYNIIGDGKFDQTKLPDAVDLEVGRVDFFDLPLYSKSDTMLLKNYLNRNHNWRTGGLSAIERAVIDNNFTSYNLASTGYGNFSALVPFDSIFTNRDFMAAQKSGSYLWSYGCGAGSYTNCVGVASSSDFNNDSFNNIFTIMAGSFFGDWDSKNNLLRSPLATSSLANFWGGIPRWYVHHMGLGRSIGFGTKITQNNVDFYDNGNFNNSYNSVHIALMGDPTLRIRNLNPPGALVARSINKIVYLNWYPSNKNKDGYHVYRVDSLNNYFRINTQIITDTFYTDDKNYHTGNYTYAVKAAKVETTPSGSFTNVSGASIVNVDHINGINKNEVNTVNIELFPNPSAGIFNIKFGEDLNLINELYITDMNGKIFFRINNEPISINKFIFIDGSFLPVGIYLLNGNIDSKFFAKKLVIIN